MPLWVTALHLIAACSHGVVFFNQNAVLQIYALLQGLLACPIMLLIVVASASRQRRSIRTPTD